MSSEMRKELEQLADECDGLEGLGSGVIAQRIRALLARTEAGADGVVGAIEPQDLARWVTEKLCGFDRKRYDLPVVTMDLRTAFSMLPRLFTHPQDASGDAVTEADIVALVAGPYKYHHKMDEQAEREAKAFDRCRELTIQKVQTFFAMRAAMQAKEAK